MSIDTIPLLVLQDHPSFYQIPSTHRNDAIMSPYSATALLQTIDKAQLQGLCPNRIWQSGARRNGWGQKLEAYLPRFCESLPQGALSHEDHSACTLDYCEFSSRNFTAVLQYHERYEYEPGDQKLIAKNHADTAVCFPIQGLFDDKVLVEAVKRGRLTPWTLDGRAILEHPRPFMAISHVWSDGTGLGQWASKSVNLCLYEYLKGMAKRFGCEGIWWDTLCVPQDREARGTALSIMDRNYAYARLTLVHDRFLRNLPFRGPDDACFAIVMSSWFTRGWTALELARSRKVKIVFSDSVQDLDHNILEKADEQNVAARTIRNLRNATFSGLDELLSTLAPRYTSWAKDRATIAGLLATVPPKPTQDKETWQRDIYQEILRSIGKLSHGHLFHKTATMGGGFNWCPTDIFGLPQTEIIPILNLKHNGDLHGPWDAVALDEKVRDQVLEKAIWGNRHPLLEDNVRQAIERDWWEHLLLAIPSMPPQQVPGSCKNIRKAVVVKLMKARSVEDGFKCRFVGSLDFQSAVNPERSLVRAITIGDTKDYARLGEGEAAWKFIVDGKTEAMLEDLMSSSEKKPQEHPPEPVVGNDEFQDPRNLQSGLSFDEVCQWTSLHHAAWLHVGDDTSVGRVLDGWKDDWNQQDSRGQHALHLAGERGDARFVKELVSRFKITPRSLGLFDNIGQTPLHRAAWGGSANAVHLMLNTVSGIDGKDLRGHTALHLAASQGFDQVVSCLCEEAAAQSADLVNLGTNQGLTALAYASLKGNYDVVKHLLDAGAAIDVTDEIFKWTPLHFAANLGHTSVVRLLVEKGADTERSDIVGWTALHLAAMSGRSEVVRLLGQKQPELMWRRDNQGWSPIHFATVNNHSTVVTVLKDTCLEVSIPDGVLCSEIQEIFRDMVNPKIGQKHLERAAGRQELARVLASGTSDTKRNVSKLAFTRMHLAAIDGRPGVTWRLLDGPLGSGKTSRGSSTEPNAPLSQSVAHWAAHDCLYETVGLFTQFGADMNLRNERGQTPLWIAAANGHELMARLLLENEASDEITDNNEQTMMTSAAAQGNYDLVKLLFDTGKVHPDKAGPRTYTPISHAAINGHKKVVRLLLDTEKVSLGPMGRSGEKSRTPLYFAVLGGHESIVKILLEAGGSATATSDGDPTLLTMAASSGHDGIVKLLMKHGAKAREGTHKGFPLHCAAEGGHENVVKTLLEESDVSDVNKEVRRGDLPLWSPIFFATKNGHEGVVRILLETQKVHVNSWDEFRRTPLHYAAMFGFEGVARLLMEAGDDTVDSGDAWDHSPRWYARKSGYRQVGELLDSKSSESRLTRAFRRRESYGEEARGPWAYLNSELRLLREG